MAAFLSILASPSPNLTSTNDFPKRPLAILNSQSNKMRVTYPLKEGQSRQFHSLPSGLNMEAIVQKNNRRRETLNPPLVFVHGSYHAAWCWAEQWLPCFSHSGFDCYAISLLGQGESGIPDGFVAGTLQTHAGDIADFIGKNLDSPPVLLGHSFGGLIIQYYIANLKNGGIENSYPELIGAVLVCSVPPSGNGGLVWRYLFTKLLHLSYQELMKESSRMPLFDLRKLNATLPVPSVPRSSIDILVLGAKDDFIVDTEGLKETGDFYGVSPVCVEGIAHDMMLDCAWENGAKVIGSWLRNLTEIVSPGLLLDQPC